VLVSFVRRLLLGGTAIVAVSLGTYWFFSRNFYGPDYGRPILPAWWNWLKGVPSGRSFGHVYGIDVPQLAPALVHTLILLAVTLVLVVGASISIGSIAASHAGTLLDTGLRVFSYAAWAIPAFLSALILQSVFSWAGRSFGIHPFALFGWPGYCPAASPTDFYNGPCVAGTGLGYAGNLARHVLLPAVALAVSFIGLHSRYLRSSLLVALHAPYTTTARAKGLSERRVLLRHALRNSLVTFVSVLLLDFASLFGAALAVDWVFKIGGLGTLFISEIANPTIDPNQVTSLLFLTALIVLAVSLLSDLILGFLDPRIHLA
jgi:peptide/nickel transport system permease protein